MKRVLLGLLFAVGLAGVSQATVYGTGTISNTYYIVSMTTSITGAKWIDCRGATKVIFEVTYQDPTDHTARVGGVTQYIDSSNNLYSNLVTLNKDSVWTGAIQSAAIISNADDTYTVTDPPNSLRWRILGPFLLKTMSVRYKIVF